MRKGECPDVKIRDVLDGLADQLPLRFVPKKETHHGADGHKSYRQIDRPFLNRDCLAPCATTHNVPCHGRTENLALRCLSVRRERIC